jgi:hypothetical protein
LLSLVAFLVASYLLIWWRSNPAVPSQPLLYLALEVGLPMEPGRDRAGRGDEAERRDQDRGAAKQLQGGDLFFPGDPSHGGQVRDVNGDEGDDQDGDLCSSALQHQGLGRR